jgi:alkylation response protein AidB-like acyl-CoA dehydrogenase
VAEFLERIARSRSAGWDRLPLPGGGRTPARHRALAALGRTDLALARIAEGHTDALAILAEAGHAPRAGALYGVWASDGPQSLTRAARRACADAWHLEGVKQYCSGAPFVDAALVTAHGDEGLMLFDVDLKQPRVRRERSVWQTPALADTATAAVAFDQVAVRADDALGAPGWYLTRPGFWHGAIGPAACWAGGAFALVDAAVQLARRDPHSQAQVGALKAAAWGMHALLEQSGREIDGDPADRAAAARERALIVRHLIERACTEVLDRFGRATGPQLLAYNAEAARQHMGLALYIRQCHAERDLQTIGAASDARTEGFDGKESTGRLSQEA